MGSFTVASRIPGAVYKNTFSIVFISFSYRCRVDWARGEFVTGDRSSTSIYNSGGKYP